MSGRPPAFWVRTAHSLQWDLSSMSGYLILPYPDTQPTGRKGGHMKVCEICGDEIFTMDGDNRCEKCRNKAKASKRTRLARKERDAIMRSMGLTKCKGALGGVYWE